MIIHITYPLIAVISALLAFAGQIELALIFSVFFNFVICLVFVFLFLRGGKISFMQLFICGSIFLFFFFENLNPKGFQRNIILFSYLSNTAVALNLFFVNLAPSLIFIAESIWIRIFKIFNFESRVASFSYVKYHKILKSLFYIFLVLFGILFLLYLVSCNLIQLSLSQIIYMRAGDGALLVSGLALALAGLLKVCFSLIPYCIILLKSKYKYWILLALPFALLWSAGWALSGTRTLLLMLALLLFLCYFFTIGIKYSTIFLAVFTSATIFISAQLMVKARTVGWSNFDIGHGFSEILDVQGLQAMADQAIAIQYLEDRYAPLWITPNHFLGLPIGIIHRGTEFIYYWLPRAIFTFKPLDPTFANYTGYSHLLRTGKAKERVTGKQIKGRHTGFGNNMTPGLFGRDMVRYGYSGPFVTSFWMGMFVAIGGIYYKYRQLSLIHSVIAASAFALLIMWFRELNIMWTATLIPFLIPAILQTIRR